MEIWQSVTQMRHCRNAIQCNLQFYSEFISWSGIYWLLICVSISYKRWVGRFWKNKFNGKYFPKLAKVPTIKGRWKISYMFLNSHKNMVQKYLAWWKSQIIELILMCVEHSKVFTINFIKVLVIWTACFHFSTIFSPLEIV